MAGITKCVFYYVQQQFVYESRTSCGGTTVDDNYQLEAENCIDAVMQAKSSFQPLCCTTADGHRAVRRHNLSSLIG